MMIASDVAEEKLAYYEKVAPPPLLYIPSNLPPEKLVNTIIPLISNSKVAVRHLAITSVLAIWKNATDLYVSSTYTHKILY